MVARDESSSVLSRLNWVASETDALLSNHSASSEPGDFGAVFERRGSRIRFEWDASENILSVLIPNDAADGADRWNLDARISLPHAEGLFEELCGEIEDQL
jgi:YD repeat-containing protein